MSDTSTFTTIPVTASVTRAGYSEFKQAPAISTAANTTPSAALGAFKIVRISPGREPSQIPLRMNVRLLVEQERISAINETLRHLG
jgi:hypothetical protein